MAELPVRSAARDFRRMNVDDATVYGFRSSFQDGHPFEVLNNVAR